MRALPTILLALCSLAQGLPAAEPIRVACLGDSLTQGAKVDAATQSYPAQLQAMLGVTFRVKNLGKGGATLWHGGKPNAAQELPEATAFAPQIAIVAFGANDTRSRDVPYWSHFGELEADATKLLDTLLAANPKPRILLCLPVAIQADLPGLTGEVRANRAERGPRLQEIMGLLRKLGARYAAQGVEIVDLHTPTLQRPELFADDAVHLKTEGYQLLAETLRPHVEATAKQLGH